MDSFLDDSINVAGFKTTTNKQYAKTSMKIRESAGRTTPSHGLLNLPNIKRKNSPFKGLLDFSMTTKKLKENDDARKIKNKSMIVNYKSIDPVDDADQFLPSKQDKDKSVYDYTKGDGVKMNPRVMETWINETLLDAQDLGIPGTILNPNLKNPISRYQVDNEFLISSGISEASCARIHRALYVYSLGFYNLMKKEV